MAHWPKPLLKQFCCAAVEKENNLCVSCEENEHTIVLHLEALTPVSIVSATPLFLLSHQLSILNDGGISILGCCYEVNISSVFKVHFV